MSAVSLPLLINGQLKPQDCVTPGNEGEDMPKTEVPWQGCISWSWRKTAAVHGKFQACFIPAALCSPGASWSNKEYTGLDSLQALPEQLDLGNLFPPSQEIAESLWSAWSGDILLLSRQNPLLFHSRNGKQRLDNAFQFWEDTSSGNCPFSHLCGDLQHHRLSGCLRGSGAALMAQGPSQRRLNKAHTARAACERLPEALDQPADDFTCSIKAVHATHSLSTVQAEAAGVSPAINILVVDLEHLRRWLPEHALDDKKLADIAAQAELHRSSTCVLIMMQKMKASQEQQPSSAEQHQPSSLQQPYAEDKKGSPDQVSLGMHCSSPGADRDPMQQAALSASVQKKHHAKREHPDADSPYSQSKRLKLQLDMYALQLAEQQGEPQQQQQFQEVVDNKQEEVLVSIFSGMEHLGLLPSSKHASQALPASQLEGLQALGFLTQLRFASLFAISYQKVCTVSQHFHLTMAALQQKPETTSWLIHRCGPPAKRTLCRESQELYDQLSADTEWPDNARADLIAQVIPADLQPAYILSLAGYAGADPLAVYAADVMQCILQAAHQAAQDSPTAQLAQRVTRDSLEQATTGTSTQSEGLKLPLQFTPVAGRSASMSPVSSCSFSGSSSTGSPESKPSRHTQPHAPDKIDMNRVLNRVENALIRLRLLPTYLPKASVSRLQKVSFFHQLLVLSRFCATVEPRQDVPCCLMRLCKSAVRRHMMKDCLHDVLPYSSDRPMKELTNLAWTVHVFETRQSQHQAEAALLALPQQLQCVAACYAIGTFMVSRDDEEALLTVQHGVAQMQDLFQQALSLRKSRR